MGRSGFIYSLLGAGVQCPVSVLEAGSGLEDCEAVYEHGRVFGGRGGASENTRPFHLYILKPEGVESVEVEDRRFVGYARKHLDHRSGGVSKALRILDFLVEHRDEAFFSRDVIDSLKGYGVKTGFGYNSFTSFLACP